VLLVSCGLGGPPWSEEIVILGSGYFVANDQLGFTEAIMWCWSGIIVGDSIIYLLGRFVGERVYSWPILRSHFLPIKRKRFEDRFHAHGTKATFLARFFPGFRMIAFFVAGNMRFSYLKFVALDSIGAALTVPVSIWIGSLAVKEQAAWMKVIHDFKFPLLILGALGLSVIIYLMARKRRVKLRNLLHLRKQRAEDDAQR
jgi:membrane protein DedA with SNARE-associated domain